jgi:hypothetical protein
MNPIGIFVLSLVILVVLFAARRWALIGMMAGVMYITEGQHVQVLGINMFSVRFLELAGFIRVMARKEYSFSTLNKLDLTLIWLYCYMTVVFLLRSSENVAYQIGMAVDAFLCYFTFRGLMSNIEDLRWFLRALLLLLVPYTLMVLFESFTRHNLFASMGGVADGTWVRGDRIRCFGSFRQPDTLGMFAASFLPLYIGLACISQERKFALVGITLCLIIPWAANSGGAASAVGMGLLGWTVFWRFRTQMRKVRWGIVIVITALAATMKAPVWYIFARASAVTGGDGWHRSYLIDVAYRHLSQWWLCGMSAKETSGWFAYTLGGVQDQADICDQFISFGLIAGLPALILFIFLLVRAYGNLGKAMAVVRQAQKNPGPTEFLLFGLGVMLLVHIMDWFGITYFDQMYVVWFMQLATISTLCEQQLQSLAKVTGPVTETENSLSLGNGSSLQST